MIEYCDHGGGVELVVRLWFRVYSGSHLDVRRFAQQRAVLENGELCLSSELKVVAVNGLALVVLRGRERSSNESRAHVGVISGICKLHVAATRAHRVEEAIDAIEIHRFVYVEAVGDLHRDGIVLVGC